MRQEIPLGEIVRFHRKKGGLTQKELASLAGVGTSSVYEIEKGKCTIQFETLLKVCGVLNISVEFKSPLMNEFFRSRGYVDGASLAN